MSTDGSIIVSETGEQEPHQVFLEPALEKQPSYNNHLFYALAFICFIITVAGAFWVSSFIVEERRQSVTLHQTDRLKAQAEGKADVINTWIDGVAASGNRLLRSDLVSLYVTENGISSENSSLENSLSLQTPYMQAVLDEVARQHQLIGVYLVDREGQLLVADTDAPPISQIGNNLSKTVIDTHQSQFDLRVFQGSVLLEAAQPIVSSLGDQEAPAGVLVLLKSPDQDLTDLLKPSQNWLTGEEIFLAAGNELWIRHDGENMTVSEKGETPVGDSAWLAASAEVSGSAWQIVNRIPKKVALASFNELARYIKFFAIGLCLVLFAITIAAFGLQRSRHHSKMALEYKSHAKAIAKRENLLSSIINNTGDLITLLDQNNKIRFVNRTFAGHARTRADNARGKLLSDYLMNEHYEPVEKAIEVARAGGHFTNEDLLLDLGGKSGRYHAHFDAISEDGDKGVLLVARDLTELMEAKQKRELLLVQVTSSFTRAIELIDPYLDGHSKRVCDLALNIAFELDLDSDDVRTIELSASLCQIGKIFVPRHIVSKPGRHTEEEARQMRTHIGHALKVLENVDFGLPVAETIGQLHERCDGTGYPNRLTGGEILPTAKILMVADVYCARTQPRSYRGQAGKEEMITFFKEQIGRYDPAVVEALIKIGEQETGEEDRYGVKAVSTLMDS